MRAKNDIEQNQWLADHQPHPHSCHPIITLSHHLKIFHTLFNFFNLKNIVYHFSKDGKSNSATKS